MTTSTSKLAREEWDFEAFIPKIGDNLDFLFGYEFGREVEHIVEAYAKDCRALRRIDDSGNWHCVLVKRTTGQIDFDDCFPYADSPHTYDVGFLPPEHIPHFEYEIIDVPAGFPGTPYLLLNPPHEWSFHSRFPRIPKRSGFTGTYQSQGALVDGNREFATQDEVFTVRIQWDLSDGEIQEDFARWLSAVPRPRPAIERRGQGGGREMMADLKALGAWRLLQVHKGNIQAARSFTRQQGKVTDLYVRDDDWRKAQDRAQAILDDWKHRDICG